MNVTNNHDDPRLTAYVLGELSQPEREQIEAMLRDDESARQVVEEIRATAGLLTSELQNQSTDVMLTNAQREAIGASALRPQRSARSRFMIRVASGLAAAAVIGVGIYVSAPRLNRARELASNRTRNNGVQQTPLVESVAAAPQSSSPATTPGNSVTWGRALQSGEVGGEQAIPDEKAKRSRDEVASKYPNEGLVVQKEVETTTQTLEGVASSTPAANPRVSQADAAASGIPNAPLAVTGKIQEKLDSNDSILMPVDDPNAVASQSQQSQAGPPSAAGYKSNGTFEAGFAVAKDSLQNTQGIRQALESRNTESYDRITDNAFLEVAQNPLSTFSIDVDTASYSNVRRFINEMSQLPPKDAVRIEEMINYFPYSYPAAKGDAPFGAAVEVAGCPWNSEHRLVRIALKGKEIAKENRPASNLVFLIDVSGSMADQNKLPLLKNSMQRMVRELRESDRVAIVVYAGNSGLVLPSTTCDSAHQQTIIDSLGKLEAGGSTNGASGIELAYQVAAENFIKEGTNRVILCTDGDFNVGVTNQGDLTRMIEENAKSNVFLSVLGFGMGNVKDSTMEKLADKGNGNYAYIDTASEAQKVLVEQMSGTLITIAKDVKIQVEFNPAKVGTYRLIGYENRMLAKEDFNDDKKDAGEIGAGHTVTALYEIAPVGAKGDAPAVDPLKYQPHAADKLKTSADLLTVKLRYKAPYAPIEQGTSKLLEFPVKDSDESFAKASKDFKFASAVAAFGMVLRDSPYKGTATLAAAMELAQDGRGADENGYRGEFIEMIRKAKTLSKR